MDLGQLASRLTNGSWMWRSQNGSGGLKRSQECCITRSLESTGASRNPQMLAGGLQVEVRARCEKMLSSTVFFCGHVIGGFWWTGELCGPACLKTNKFYFVGTKMMIWAVPLMLPDDLSLGSMYSVIALYRHTHTLCLLTQINCWSETVSLNFN